MKPKDYTVLKNDEWNWKSNKKGYIYIYILGLYFKTSSIL